MPKRFGLSATTLKFIMAGLMLLDHLYYFLPGQPIWFTYLGRLVAPTFCYLMAQSLRHTRDRKTYLRRMTAAGFVMLLGGILLQLAVNGPPIRNTIILSLAAGGVIVDRIEKISQEGPRVHHFVLLAVTLPVAVFFLEGGILIPALSVVFYFLDGRKAVMSACYIAVSILIVFLWFHQLHYQLLQIFALIPIFLYNGERGLSGAFAKWFFYLFYPIHVWALYLIARF